MTELAIISFWTGFALGAWAARRNAKDPTYFKTRAMKLFRLKARP